jgi:hypothetical protein
MADYPEMVRAQGRIAETIMELNKRGLKKGGLVALALIRLARDLADKLDGDTRAEFTLLACAYLRRDKVEDGDPTRIRLM